MSPRYYHVTHFLAYPNEICTVAIRKIGNMQDILFVRIFLFWEYLWGKLRFILNITSIVQLPYASPPIPFGTNLSHT